MSAPQAKRGDRILRNLAEISSHRFIGGTASDARNYIIELRRELGECKRIITDLEDKIMTNKTPYRHIAYNGDQKIIDFEGGPTRGRAFLKNGELLCEWDDFEKEAKKINDQ